MIIVGSKLCAGISIPLSHANWSRPWSEDSGKGDVIVSWPNSITVGSGWDLLSLNQHSRITPGTRCVPIPCRTKVNYVGNQEPVRAAAL